MNMDEIETKCFFLNIYFCVLNAESFAWNLFQDVLKRKPQVIWIDKASYLVMLTAFRDLLATKRLKSRKHS